MVLVINTADYLPGAKKLHPLLGFGVGPEMQYAVMPLVISGRYNDGSSLKLPAALHLN